MLEEATREHRQAEEEAAAAAGALPFHVDIDAIAAQEKASARSPDHRSDASTASSDAAAPANDISSDISAGILEGAEKENLLEGRGKKDDEGEGEDRGDGGLAVARGEISLTFAPG